MARVAEHNVDAAIFLYAGIDECLDISHDANICLYEYCVAACGRNALDSLVPTLDVHVGDNDLRALVGE